MDVIDRRLNPSGKSLPNRQRFLRRAQRVIREAVRDASANRSIREIGTGGVVVIPGVGIDEPRLRVGAGGVNDYVLPGNKEFVEGDLIARPQGAGQGGGGAGNNPGGGGKGEDGFSIALSADEFLEFFLEDLELPDLERRKISKIEITGLKRAGYTIAGSPQNLAITRTMRNAMSRRIALGRPKQAEIAALEARLSDVHDPERRAPLERELNALQARSRAIPYIDPIDLRYRRFEPVPRPIAQAVVFCVMDVSGSMSQHMKDVAKRFFMLLFVFLTKRYKHVDVVFIRHTDDAKEVDEDTFFNSRETGGTRVSTALEEMQKVLAARYPVADWNIYVAQATDGDNEPGDNAKTVQMMRETILPVCQYYAYLEVDEPHHTSGARSSLWRAFESLGADAPAMRRVTTRQEIYPVFRDLFQRQAASTS